MSVSIRLASTEDGKAITNLSSQLGYDISEEQIMLNIQSLANSQHDVVYVALVDDNVVGWMHVFYALKLESKPFCEIAGLVIDESLRGQGIGKILIEKAIEWSADRSSETLRVRTNVIRTQTHKFYEATGFKLMKQQNVYGINISFS